MARHFVETMRGMFQWAVDAEHVKDDPTRDVKVSKPKTEGLHIWSDEECDKSRDFEASYEAAMRETPVPHERDMPPLSEIRKQETERYDSSCLGHGGAAG